MKNLLIKISAALFSIGEKAHDILFGFMVRSGMILMVTEINSKEAAKIAAGSKIDHSDHGRDVTMVITTPLVFAQLAIGDIMASGQKIPKGSRIIAVRKNHGTGTASSTFDLGLRQLDAAKTVVDADGLTAVTAATTATTTSLDCGNGALLAAGIDYKTLTDVEPYLTAQGAVLAANQAVRIEIDYIGP